MLGTGMAGDARRRSRRGRGGHLGGFRAGAGGRGSKYRGSAASADTADTAASQRGVQSPTIKGSCSRPNPKKAKLSQGRTADAAAVGEDSATCPGAGGDDIWSGLAAELSAAAKPATMGQAASLVSQVVADAATALAAAGTRRRRRRTTHTPKAGRPKKLDRTVTTHTKIKKAVKSGRVKISAAASRVHAQERMRWACVFASVVCMLGVVFVVEIANLLRGPPFVRK